MTDDMPIATGHILGLAAGMGLYGWYLATFLRVFAGLWARRRSSKVVTWITIILFLLTNLNIAMCIAEEYNAWILYRVDPGLQVYFSFGVWSNPREVGNILLLLGGMVADILVCWRLYAIWNQNRLVILFPASFIVADTALGLGIHFITIKTHNILGGPRYANYFRFGYIVATVGTVLVHLYCTAMIAARLWWIGRRAQNAQGRSLYNVVIMSLVQSGALYTVTLVVYTILQTTGYYGVGAFVNYILVMVIAIAPLLLVVQLHEKITSESNTTENNRRPRLSRSEPSRSGNIRLKDFRSTHHSGANQIVSNLDGRRRQQAISAASNLGNSVHVQINVEVDEAKVDYGYDEEGEISLPSSTKFVTEALPQV
ncbi:hypothetical protein FRB94_004713 [Tulasnella sp. JGI-2019a]|nr:hypothetical protein FRB94_004713 [Tulasnella sp. JGI-2019a]KAG9036657.1 hypothetical protein FRB95_008241 [Tulasnella sp. JGI-2019a]